MSSAPTSSPTITLEQANTLGIFASSMMLLLLCFVCIGFGSKYNHYILNHQNRLTKKFDRQRNVNQY